MTNNFIRVTIYCILSFNPSRSFNQYQKIIPIFYSSFLGCFYIFIKHLENTVPLTSWTLCFGFPMSYSERSRCVCWKLDWPLGSQPKPCLKHHDSSLSKKHTIQCLDMHRRLQRPTTIEEPMSFLLNLLPTRKPRSFQYVPSWIPLQAHHMSNSF